jgi:hypothetical protein
VAEWVDT